MKFEALNNTRELGGIPTSDGRHVRHGRLFRSGRLIMGSPKDIETLAQAGITRIIDFRSREEQLEKPDPALPDAENVSLPAVKDMTAGITRDERSDGKALEAIIYQSISEEGFAMKYMCSMYRNFVADDFARSQYSRFVRMIADGADKDVFLWHCNTGKDRAGFAAVILLTILGADRETILEDYLVTNGNIAEEVAELTETFTPAGAPDSARDAVRLLFSADEQFLNALYEKADELYGSFDGFLADGLGVDDALRERLRRNFLE